MYTIRKTQTAGGTATEDVPINRWHLRRLSNVNGTIKVALPKSLVKWSREREVEPWRWSAGDYVKIALTSSGKFVIEYVETNSLKGEHNPMEEREWDFAEPEPRSSPILPKRMRRKYQQVTYSDSGMIEKVEVKTAEDERLAKDLKLWMDEVVRWRHRLELSQEDAAGYLGITVRTLRRWEKGDTRPKGIALRDAIRERMRETRKMLMLSGGMR